MIELASPDITTEDVERVVSVLKSGNLVQGEQAAKFEAALSEFIGLPNCAVVSSGTAALHLALLALGIGPGDTVIVPAFTFPASANSVIFAGAEVLLCDVEPGSYVVTASLLETVIKNNSEKNIKAIMVVHEFGFPVEMPAVRALADKYHLKLIEDAACALGSLSKGAHVGHLGDAACFSFHPRKAITTGEGGAVVSRDPELIARVRALSNHGMKRTEAGIDFLFCGLNYRMTDIQAALGVGQLSRFRDELTKRAALVEHYFLQLESVSEVTLPLSVSGHSWQSFMVILDKRKNRELLMKSMLSSGVRVNLGAQAISDLPCFQEVIAGTDCNCARQLYRSGLVLPLYGKLNESDLDLIVSSFKKALHDC